MMMVAGEMQGAGDLEEPLWGQPCTASHREAHLVCDHQVSLWQPSSSVALSTGTDAWLCAHANQPFPAGPCQAYLFSFSKGTNQSSANF